MGVLLENGHTFIALEHEVLKDFDAHVVRELREHTGFNARLCPVGLSTGLDEWFEDIEELNIKAWGHVFSFEEADLEAMRAGHVARGPDPPLPSSDIPLLFGADVPQARRAGEPPQSSGTLVDSVYYPSVEWTGNESEEGYDKCQYVSSAAILTKNTAAAAI